MGLQTSNPPFFQFLDIAALGLWISSDRLLLITDHAKYECNYGVPLIDFDRLFGTWQDYGEYEVVAKGKIAAKAK